MRTLKTQIEINASSDKVWQTLTDFDAYGDWNPFVTSISGTLTPRAKLAVTLCQPESKPMSIAPTVTTVKDGQGFSWKGRLLIPGIFDGEHHFELTPLAEGKTRLTHYETFSGLLVPLFKKMLDTKTRRGFEAMNAALKERVEGS